MKRALWKFLIAFVILSQDAYLRADERPIKIKACNLAENHIFYEDLLPRSDTNRYGNRVYSDRSPPPAQASFFSPGSTGANGPALAGAAVDAVGTISDAFGSFGRADQERSLRYAWRESTGQTPEQKVQQYREYQSQTYAKLEHESELRNLEYGKATLSSSSHERREEFDQAVSRAAANARAIRETSANTVQSPDTRELVLNVVGLSDNQIAYLIAAADQAMASTRPARAPHIIAERWATRAEKIHAYWTNESVRRAYSKLRLSSRAQGTFFLGSIEADSFETHEIISVANQLAREATIVGDPINRMLVTVMLNQAHRYALEGEILSSSMMVENALNVRDFSRGLATGLFENIYDTASGLWHLMRHPIDSINAIASALVNYEETFDIIVTKVSDVINEFPAYTAEEKGRFFGYVATEIAVTVGTVGTNWIGDLAKSARFVEGVGVAVENTAHILKTPGFTRFEAKLAALSPIGRQNVEFLREYARREGYILKDNPLGKPEEWGVFIDSKWEWRVKIKPEASMREGLLSGSQTPRASARLDANGHYVNPFTGEVGGRPIGGHIPLERDWFPK